MHDADESTLERPGSGVGAAEDDQPGRVDPADFGVIAMRNGLLKRDELDHCLKVQTELERVEGKKRPLDMVVVEQGYMTSLEVKAVTKARERYLREKAKTEGIRIQGYEIMSTLGEGGLGVVYKARQISMNRLVALKVLHKHWVSDDEFRKRFILEARVVGKLSHQNIIQVYDVGKESGYYYFAMEYVPGKTVDQLVDENGPMDAPGSVNILIHVLRAIRYYMGFDIVHRDIKPSNVIVTRQGIAKLGDFGFVKSKVDKELGYEGMVLGTPDYISPEQAMGDDRVDWRSDIYSLGATFYHMVTGEPPFEGSGSQVMLKHVKDEPPSPKEINPRIPDSVCHVIEKMMAKKPEERYPTLDLLFEDMELLRAGRSPQSPRVEMGKSTIFRALKIEQSRLAQASDERQKLENELASVRSRIDGFRAQAATWKLIAGVMTVVAIAAIILAFVVR